MKISHKDRIPGRISSIRFINLLKSTIVFFFDPIQNGQPLAKAPQVRATNHEITLLAYELWLNREEQHGSDTQDWLQAEEQLKSR